jgi:hypothetical protein
MTDKTVSHAIGRESISCSPILDFAETGRLKIPVFRAGRLGERVNTPSQDVPLG